MDDVTEPRPDQLASFLNGPDGAAFRARERWLRTARSKQIPPPGDWDLLIWLAGRFFGKTISLTEYGWYEAYRIPGLRIHAVAPTIGDVRRITFEGASGFLKRMPSELIAGYNKSLHELHLTNGSAIYGFGAVEEAERMRGPECHVMLFDEAAAADRPKGNLETAYNVASLGCRAVYPDGTPSRKLIATTPKPIPFLRNLLRRPGTVIVKGTSYENLKNVAASIQNEIMALEGTAFGRQEIYGELLDETEHAIFKRSWFRLWPNGKKLPEFSFIIISVDPAVTEHDFNLKTQTGDPTGIGVFGVFNTKQCFTDPELKKLGVKSKYAALLCDYRDERLGFPELLERIRELYRTKWGSSGIPGSGGGRRADLVLIEAEKTGISLRQSLMHYGVPTWPFSPHGQSKTMRAHAASPLVLQGMLFVPESGKPDRRGQPRDWAEPLVEQMCTFSGEGSTEHDEGVDVTTQALLELMARGVFHATPQGKAMPDPDEEDERKMREAMAIHDRQKASEKVNPYD